MSNNINLNIVEDWIAQHEPQGPTKLAAGAEISPGILNRIRKHKHVPGVDIAIRIARTIGVSLDDLCYGPSEDGSYQKERSVSK